MEYKLCKTGRAAPGDTPSKDAPSSVLEPSTKIIIFTVAGVVMVGLFGFAGVRYVLSEQHSGRMEKGVNFRSLFPSKNFIKV